MRNEKQVAPFEQARRLKELGVKQESLFYWVCGEMEYDWGDWYIRETEEDEHFLFNHIVGRVFEDYDFHPLLPEHPSDNATDSEYDEYLTIENKAIKRMRDKIYAAYTVAELRVALPPFSYSWRGRDSRWACVPSTNEPNVEDIEYSLDMGLFHKADTEAEALSDLLLHLIETGQITLEEVNRRLNEA